MSRSILRITHIETGKHWRGAQVQVLHTALGQKKLGHSVSIICPPGSALEQKARELGIDVYPQRCRLAFFGYDVMKMVGIMSRTKPDIVHLHSSHAHNIGGLAARLARVPAVILSRRMDTPITFWHHKLKYKVGYDAVIAISMGVKRALVAAGVKSEKIAVVRSAIEDHWWKAPGRRDAVRQELGYQEADVVVAVVAAIEPRKGQELLIRAMPQILKSVPNVKVLFAGKDDISQPEKDLVHQLGLDGKVLFAGFRSDIKDVIAAADIIAAPSYLEGLGVAIMEAMACGKAIVASNVGGIPESVVDGETGLLAEAGDAGELADAIVRLASDRGLREAMGQRGRQRAQSDFSVESLIADTLGVYAKVLAKAKRSSKLAGLRWHQPD